MNGPSDRFATWDAAYVLGALSPVERREYEEHLAGCAACQAAVAELAGMPGLLAQVPPEDAALLAAAPVEVLDDGPPPDLLAKIRGRSDRRWRLTRTVVGAAAALLLVLAGTAYAVGLLPFGSSEPRRVAFEAVQPTGLTAVADVVPVENGTNIEVQCAYGETNEPWPGGGYGHADYTIYVVDRAGNATEIKRWPVKPNRTMTPDGHTTLRVRQIEAVEIRYAPRDEPVLRANLR
ncbi:MAG TPA: zf-HC2 domain-containing protein [Propionibacteriaceae bacterium]|nr:zf-HC2 domain-containing protein [Propionibacteriaceae bacterium]